MTDSTTNKGLPSARSILEGLILASIVGLVAVVYQNGRDAAKADADRSVQIATLQTQVSNLQGMLAGLPELTARVTRAEVSIMDIERRQELDDRAREQSAAMKGWAR